MVKMEHRRYRYLRFLGRQRDDGEAVAAGACKLSRLIQWAHATLALTRVFSQSLPNFAELPSQTQLVVVGFRLEQAHAAELGITDCDMSWEQANDLLRKTHPSVTYFAQVPTTLDQAGEHLYQLLSWLVARKVKRLPLGL